MYSELRFAQNPAGMADNLVDVLTSALSASESSVFKYNFSVLFRGSKLRNSFSKVSKLLHLMNVTLSGY